MIYKNTKDEYGIVAIALHWIMAVGFIVAYMLVKYVEFGKPDDIYAVMQTHFTVGVSMLMFVILRIIWKITNPSPAAVTQSKPILYLGKVIHLLLYFAMVMMPVSGYLGTNADINFFGLFAVIKFPDTGLYQLLVVDWLSLEWQEFKAFVHGMHKIAGNTVLVILVVMHSGAALYHHFILRDNTLRRILGIRNRN